MLQNNLPQISFPCYRVQDNCFYDFNVFLYKDVESEINQPMLFTTILKRKFKSIYKHIKL